jgi:chemotaxis protein MotB
MKRQRHEGHVNHERWLVSYADFVTLLFAFFVVLYASAQVDKHKMARLALAIEGAFSQLGVFQGSAPGAPLDPQPAASGTGEKKQIGSPTLVEPVRANVPVNATSTGASNADLAALKRELESALSAEFKRHEIVLRPGPEGLVISLSELGFFDSGSAQMRPDAQAAFARLAKLLVDHQFDLRVEGHTDNVPIHTPQFRSNWELSTARAVEVIKMLITSYGCPATRLSAAGYGEFHPIADNSTVAGRQQNRRVDLVVLADRHRPERSAAKF